MEMTAAEIAEYNAYLDGLDNDQLARLETQNQEQPEDYRS